MRGRKLKLRNAGQVLLIRDCVASKIEQVFALGVDAIDPIQENN